MGGFSGLNYRMSKISSTGNRTPKISSRVIFRNNFSSRGIIEALDFLQGEIEDLKSLQRKFSGTQFSSMGIIECLNFLQGEIEDLKSLQGEIFRNSIFFQGNYRMSKFSSRGNRRPKISSRGNFQERNFLPWELSNV